MKFSNLFITGCDNTTKWMLPWFQDNFYRHNPDAHLKVYDFDKFEPSMKGWFKKPAAMMDATKLANKVCWLDTDCEPASLERWRHFALVISPGRKSLRASLGVVTDDDR